MNPLQRYIADEIATDHVDGLLTRREAMRRLSLLGLGTVAAAALLAACSSAEEQSKAPASSSAAETSTGPGQPPGMAHALPTSPISWSGSASQLQGAWAQAANRSRS